ncbi:hypothetical protein ACOBQJ_11345 [Pelotomaculum propionicicum]
MLEAARYGSSLDVKAMEHSGLQENVQLPGAMKMIDGIACGCAIAIIFDK